MKREDLKKLDEISRFPPEKCKAQLLKFLEFQKNILDKYLGWFIVVCKDKDNKIGYLPESVLSLNQRIVDLAGNPVTNTAEKRKEIYVNHFSKARRRDCLFL